MRILLAAIALSLSLFCVSCDIGPVDGTTITVDTARCISCGACEKVCPFDAMHLWGNERKPVVDPTKCTVCGRCIAVCPEDAIQGRPQ